MGLLTALYSPVIFYLEFKYGFPVDAKFNSLKISYPWVRWNNLLFL